MTERRPLQADHKTVLGIQKRTALAIADLVSTVAFVYPEVAQVEREKEIAFQLHRTALMMLGDVPHVPPPRTVVEDDSLPDFFAEGTPVPHEEGG